MNAPTVTPDLVQILADYFSAQDLTLCSMALAGPEDSTAYRRAVRYFTVRDAFEVPRETDRPEVAREHISRALAKFVAAQGGQYTPAPVPEPRRCGQWREGTRSPGPGRCARVEGHEGGHAYND